MQSICHSNSFQPWSPWGKDNFEEHQPKGKSLQQMMLEQLSIHIANRNFEHDAQKLNLKWIVGLSIKSEIIKLLKENGGEIFFCNFRWDIKSTNY